jgi:hypothetical protein
VLGPFLESTAMLSIAAEYFYVTTPGIFALEGRYPIGDYHQSMVTTVMHVNQGFLPSKSPGNQDYQVI